MGRFGDAEVAYREALDQATTRFGVDSPTALVVDAEGIIQFVTLSRFIFDRPDPQLLVRELKKI